MGEISLIPQYRVIYAMIITFVKCKLISISYTLWSFLVINFLIFYNFLLSILIPSHIKKVVYFNDNSHGVVYSSNMFETIIFGDSWGIVNSPIFTTGHLYFQIWNGSELKVIIPVSKLNQLLKDFSPSSFNSRALFTILNEYQESLKTNTDILKLFLNDKELPPFIIKNKSFIMNCSPNLLSVFFYYYSYPDVEPETIKTVKIIDYEFNEFIVTDNNKPLLDSIKSE